jgi:4'-phosphopantetheinyl transferase
MNTAEAESSEMSTLRVHLYGTRVDETNTAELVHAAEPMLSPDERRRRDAFVFERHRCLFAVAHGLLRAALSRHAPDVPARDWEFRTSEYGRPEIFGGDGAPPLFFNLSHTEGYVACIIAARPTIGVDVEALDRPAAIEHLGRFLAPREGADVRTLSGEHRRRRLFEYWTLREAYTKARGRGLSMALDSFSFVLRHDTSVHAALAAGDDDHAERWQFLLRRPTALHQLAVAVGEGVGISLVEEGCSLIRSTAKG